MFIKSTKHSLLLILAKTPNHQFARLSTAYCQPIKKLLLVSTSETKPKPKHQSDTDNDSSIESGSNSIILKDDSSSEESSNKEDSDSLN